MNVDKLPRTNERNHVELVPYTPALYSNIFTGVSAATTVNIPSGGVFGRIVSLTGTVLLKYGNNTPTTSDFDHIIPTGYVIDIALNSSMDPLTLINYNTNADVAVIIY